MKVTQPPAQVQEPSPILQTKCPPPPFQITEINQNGNVTVIRKEKYLTEVNEYKSVCNSDIKEKERKRNKQKEKNYSNSFQCDKCNKKYTWYSRLANHKLLLHNNVRVK